MTGAKSDEMLVSKTQEQILKEAVKDHPPPTETATIHDPVAPILCPEAPVVKKEPTPPVVKLRPKKEPEPPKPKLKSPPRLEVFEGPVDIDNDNSKWGWMRAEDKSAVRRASGSPSFGSFSDSDFYRVTILKIYCVWTFVA